MTVRFPDIRSLVRDERGFTVLEYTLITLVIGAVVVAGVDVIGGALTGAYSNISGVLAMHASGA